VPFEPPVGLVHPCTQALFNRFYYRFHAATSEEHLVPCDTYFFPLDVALNWHRVYGRPGFLQYACAFPLVESRVGVKRILDRCQSAGMPSSLVVLKKFGHAAGWLSFPIPGYTLAMDFPARPGLLPVLDDLDEIVMEHGGRVYLAKDARLRPEVLRKMYPELGAWMKVKAAVDPTTRFISALSRRLEMHPR